MLRIGVLGSTRGSDLPAVVESIQNGELKGLAEIAVVISDKGDAGILEKARGYGFVHQFLDPEVYGSGETKEERRENYDRELLNRLQDNGVELTVLIGYMKLFSPQFVEATRNKCMNIHPSLLPSFVGMDRAVHQDVLNHGCKVSGCTLFYIDEGADSGPIILQKAVQIYANDDVDSLRARVQAAEQEILPEGISLHARGMLKVEQVGDRQVVKILDPKYNIRPFGGSV